MSASFSHGAALALRFDLPSLRFSLALDVAGLPPDIAALLEARWPPRPPDDPGASGALAFDAVNAPVGLASGALVEVELVWTGPTEARLRTNAAELDLRLEAGRVAGRGRVEARRARGGVEAATRAAAVVALAARGVLVLHASAVHRGGDALVFLGDSGAGKTTTARRLGREGLSRLADDMIAVDLAASPPALHRLPFERAGRALAEPERLPRGGGVAPARCRGAALVRKGAPAAAFQPVSDAARLWSEALITLPPPPGAEPRLLACFARLLAVPLRAFDVPPRGPLAPAVLAWLDALRLDAERPPAQATPPADAPPGRPDRARGAMSDPDQATVTRVERAPHVAWRVLDGTAVLVAPSSPAVQTLNPVGTLVWELADGRTVAEIVDAVVNEFEVERTQASLDVELFVRDLAGRGLLRVAP